MKDLKSFRVSEQRYGDVLTRGRFIGMRSINLDTYVVSVLKECGGVTDKCSSSIYVIKYMFVLIILSLITASGDYFAQLSTISNML